mmetsp:Transcript_84281/g.163702  ORF Transcript_84281/g.163702 Transcript_84281/m.163702 type:complete len:156 (+) Transcript_84281:1079-1546(+)
MVLSRHKAILSFKVSPLTDTNTFKKVVGVVKKSGWFVDGPFATGNGDQHANATLVISVGKLVAFEDGFSGAPDYEIETSYFGLLGGSWSPQEFKCLEYYDWDISPPRSASSSKQTIKKVVKPLYEQRQPTSRHSKKRAGRAMENTNSNFTFLIFC